jgi:hypothetical protein
MMTMPKRRLPNPRNPKTELKTIKYHSDYQLSWNTLIPRLREYSIQTVDFLSMAGDAPKDSSPIANIGQDIGRDNNDLRVTSLRWVRSFILTNQSLSN